MAFTPPAGSNNHLPPSPPSYSMTNMNELHSSTISPNRSIAAPPPPSLHPTHKMKTAAPLPASKQAEEAPDSTARSSASAGRTAETLLRVAPMGFCLAALILTVKNSEDNDFGSISYSDLGSFKYLVYMNGVCAGYSIFSAMYTAMPRPVSMSRAWTLFFLDQVVTYAILAAGAAAAEIVYLAYEGDEDVTWSRACSIFGGFCRKATASVGITFGAVVCYILLSLISSYRLFSAYHAPISTFAGAVDDNEAH